MNNNSVLFLEKSHRLCRKEFLKDYFDSLSKYMGQPVSVVDTEDIGYHCDEPFQIARYETRQNRLRRMSLPNYHEARMLHPLMAGFVPKGRRSKSGLVLNHQRAKHGFYGRKGLASRLYVIMEMLRSEELIQYMFFFAPIVKMDNGLIRRCGSIYRVQSSIDSRNNVHIHRGLKNRITGCEPTPYLKKQRISSFPEPPRSNYEEKTIGSCSYHRQTWYEHWNPLTRTALLDAASQYVEMIDDCAVKFNAKVTTIVAKNLLTGGEIIHRNDDLFEPEWYNNFDNSEISDSIIAWFDFYRDIKRIVIDYLGHKRATLCWEERLRWIRELIRNTPPFPYVGNILLDDGVTTIYSREDWSQFCNRGKLVDHGYKLDKFVVLRAYYKLGAMQVAYEGIKLDGSTLINRVSNIDPDKYWFAYTESAYTYIKGSSDPTLEWLFLDKVTGLMQEEGHPHSYKTHTLGSFEVYTHFYGKHLEHQEHIRYVHAKTKYIENYFMNTEIFCRHLLAERFIQERFRLYMFTENLVASIRLENSRHVGLNGLPQIVNQQR